MNGLDMASKTIQSQQNASFDKVLERVKEARKDPKFRAFVKELIAATTHSK